MAEPTTGATTMRRSTSLATRVSAAFLMMLVPVGVVGAAGLTSLSSATNSFAGSSQELIGESSRVVRIRDAFGRAEESVEELLDDGDMSARTAVQDLVDRLDHELANERAWDEPPEQALVRKIRMSWANVRAFLTQAVAAAPARRDRVKEHTQFHSDLDDATALLNKLDAVALKEGAEEVAQIYAAHDRRRQLLLLALVLAATMTMSALLAQALRKSMLRPLKELQEAAQRFGSDDLEYRVVVRRQDELGVVASSFNEMAERLSHSRAALLHSQRMEGIGQLAGGVAHDFNNLLSVIQNYAGFVAEDMEPGDPRLDDIREIEGATTRATALTRQLLTFSRKDDAVVRRFEPNAAIENSRGLVLGTLPEDIEVSFKLDGGRDCIEMDPGQFDQVLLNLVVNARDAMPTGGTITVETSNITIDDEVAWGKTRLGPGRYVAVAVSDTGSGMSGEVKDRIFEPFFSTKARESGTGLGLATVYGIVAGAGGTIAVYTEIDRGTTFRIYLPLYGERREAPRDQAERIPRSGKGATILVVEDEEGIRKMVDRILTKNHYNVLTAPGPQEALQINAGYEGRIDLLLTDVVMPGQSGKSLAMQFHAARPDVPVLYMSGYTDSIISARGLLQGETLLQKPFSPDTLLAEAERAIAPQRDGVVRGHAVAATQASVAS